MTREQEAIYRNAAESPDALTRYEATLGLIAADHYLAYSDARHAAQLALTGAHCGGGDRMSNDELIERAYGAFRDEYRRIFPAGGDAQDHDEATRSAIGAVLDLFELEQTRKHLEVFADAAALPSIGEDDRAA